MLKLVVHLTVHELVIVIYAGSLQNDPEDENTV